MIPAWLRVLPLSLVLSGAVFAAESTERPALATEFSKVQLRVFLERAEEAAEAGEIEAAQARLDLLVAAWRAEAEQASEAKAGGKGGVAHSGRAVRPLLRADFFVWRHLYAAAQALQVRGELGPEQRGAIGRIARENVRPMERGPNNRSFHFALGALRAAELFPELPEAARWRAYAEAVWEDFYGPGDAYEPGYVEHWFGPALELGEELGKAEELRSEKARALYRRMRDHVSASGLAVQPGDPGTDAAGGHQATYVEGLARAAILTGDESLLEAARRALRATAADAPEREKLARLVARAGEKLGTGEGGIGVKTAARAEPLAQMQYLFPATHRIPDRLLLSLPEAPAAPYLGLYAMDRTEVLFHGHEDNRGEIYHYEADGALLLRRAGWIKWPGAANTFVVADARAQFPLATTRGPEAKRWYAGSGNLSHLRDFIEGEGWARTADSPSEQNQAALSDTRTGLGYAWANPAGLAGAHDTVELREVTLRFLAIPEAEARAAEKKGDHYLGSLSFDAGMAWYREYRAVAPAPEGGLEFLVARPRLAGAGGEWVLADGELPPEGARLVYFAAGAGEAERGGREIPRAEWGKFIRAAPGAGPAGGAAWRVICPPGRLDLVLPVGPRRVDIVKELPRVELDYRIETPTRDLLRAPLAVAVNGLRPRSLYLDGQQGGRLVDHGAERRGEDAGGFVSYEGAWAADTRWTRRVVLTREGVLVVLDGFATGARLGDAAGGPVWQLPSAPTAGLNWFDAPAAGRPEKSLLVWFHPREGDEAGAQFQAKLFGLREHAVYARRLLEPGKTEWFLSVLVPHDTELDAATLTGARNTQGRLREADPARAGLFTELGADGAARVRLAPRDQRWSRRPLVVTVGADGAWAVTRE